MTTKKVKIIKALFNQSKRKNQHKMREINETNIIIINVIFNINDAEKEKR